MQGKIPGMGRYPTKKKTASRGHNNIHFKHLAGNKAYAMEPSWLKTSPSHRDARGKFAQQHPQRLLYPTEQQCSVCGF